MRRTELRRAYWDKRILPWEEARYGDGSILRPQSWSVRRRMRFAARWIRENTPAGCRILDLGCGSGLLGEALQGHWASYHGLDLSQAAVCAAKRRIPSGVFVAADVVWAPLPDADLVVFLGLLDWLEPDELGTLFRRLSAKRLLFSFTEEARWSPYRIYRSWVDQRLGEGRIRARSYSFEEMQRLSGPLQVVRGAGPLDPGWLVSRP